VTYLQAAAISMIVRARPITVVGSALQASIDVPTENARDVLDKSIRVNAYAIARSAFGAEAQLAQGIQTPLLVRQRLGQNRRNRK
jgi:hypothetical protein